jgi:hypothetical protein
MTKLRIAGYTGFLVGLALSYFGEPYMALLPLSVSAAALTYVIYWDFKKRWFE